MKIGLRNRPYLLIITNLFCNHKCSYCIQQESSLDVRKNPNKIDVPAVLAFLKRNRIASSIKVMGGEATLHPDFEALMDGLVPLYRKIVVTSNLNGKWYDDFDAAVSAMGRWRNYVKWNLTYHPAWMDRDTFVARVHRLKDAGIHVGQVAATDTADLSDETAEALNEAGIGWKLQPFTGRSADGRLVPQTWEDVRTQYPLEWDVSKYIENYEEYTADCEDANASSDFYRPEWVKCVTSKFLIGPDNNVYPCHRHLYAEDSRYACGTVHDVGMEKFRPRWNRLTNTWSLPCNTKCNPCDFRNVKIASTGRPNREYAPSGDERSAVAQG